MSMRPLMDVSPAFWIVDADADWWTKALYGPPGFAAYARVKFDLSDDDDSYVEDVVVMQSVLDHLASHTATPETDSSVSGTDGACRMPATTRPQLVRRASPSPTESTCSSAARCEWR